MDGTWVEVKIVTASNAVEPVSGIFYGLDVKGVAIEDPNDVYSRETGPFTWDFVDINILEYGDKAAVVKGYFCQEDSMNEVLSHIQNKLNELKEMGIDIGEGKILSREVHEEDWANNWKQYYKPTKIGKKIVIKPIWEDYVPSKDEVIVELDPGMAFGTGTHETTRMCVEALEEYITPNSTVFDIGTGSGILAIVAAKLNANHVVGVDLDPVAVDSAKHNASFNKIDNIEILEGNLMDVVNGKADIVIANIIAEVVIFLAESVKSFIVEGGHFIASGIIHEQREQVVNKLVSCGFEIKEVKEDGEWICIVSVVK